MCFCIIGMLPLTRLGLTGILTLRYLRAISVNSLFQVQKYPYDRGFYVLTHPSNNKNVNLKNGDFNKNERTSIKLA